MIVSKTIDAYVKAIGDAGRPLEFSEITAVTPGINCFRFLKTRGLIRDTGRGYRRPNARYNGSRLARYVLTRDGEQLYDAIRQAELMEPVIERFLESDQS